MASERPLKRVCLGLTNSSTAASENLLEARTASGGFKFLDMPAELRLMVYTYCIKNNDLVADLVRLLPICRVINIEVRHEVTGYNAVFLSQLQEDMDRRVTEQHCFLHPILFRPPEILPMLLMTLSPGQDLSTITLTIAMTNFAGSETRLRLAEDMQMDKGVDALRALRCRGIIINFECAPWTLDSGPRSHLGSTVGNAYNLIPDTPRRHRLNVLEIILTSGDSLCRTELAKDVDDIMRLFSPGNYSPQAVRVLL